MTGPGSCSDSITQPDTCSGGGGGTGGGGTGGGGPGGGGTGGAGGSTSTGACGFYDPNLNRLLCGQTSTSGCSGNFFGVGTSCATYWCPWGATSPQQCSLTGGAGGGGGTGGGTGGGGGSGLICGRYTIVEAGSSSIAGSGVILDSTTGFRWTRYASGPFNQANAISHCAGRGMKLPSRAEAGALLKCCVQTGTVNDCNAAFPGVWQTWTTTLAGSGNAYYAMTPGFTCLPSTCITPVTSTHGVMCFK